MKTDKIPCFPRLQCAVSPQPISSPHGPAISSYHFLNALTTLLLPCLQLIWGSSSTFIKELLHQFVFGSKHINTNYGITATMSRANVESYS